MRAAPVNALEVSEVGEERQGCFTHESHHISKRFWVVRLYPRARSKVRGVNVCADRRNIPSPHSIDIGEKACTPPAAVHSTMRLINRRERIVAKGT